MKNSAALSRKPAVRTRIRRNYQYYLMILPALVFFAVFAYYPMYGITLAFKDFRYDTGIFFSPWVGLKYFKSFFAYYGFWTLLRNTLVISAFKIFLYFPFPIILALLINEVQHQAFKRVVQTISYLPNFISWAAAVVILQQFLSLDGMVNNIRNSMGLQDIFFMNDPKYFYSIMFGSYVWKNIGMGSIIYLSAIAGIDPSLYESALMDGCGRFKQMIHITLPQIMPLATVLFILGLGSVLNAGWDQIYLIRTPGNMGLSDILDTYVLDVGLTGGQFSYGTAVSLFQSVIGLVLILLTNSFSKRISEVGIF